MKKIFISLAAIAALASCVEEKGLEPQPQQPVGNQVTIKAVAAETKTALAADGTSIVWEDGDAISLIFDCGDEKSSVICTTELDTPNSTAEFTGDLTDIESAKVAENINVLYPADAFDTSEETIKFKVPAEQDGTVGSGDNLSYALLTKNEIAGGTAEARFTNALALFKITVPEGVKTVTLTANTHLSGTGTYKFIETGELVLFSTDMGSSNNTVVLTSEIGLDAGTYDVLVFPQEIKYLTLELTGTDGATYTKTMSNNDNVLMTLEAGKYYNLKMANIFSWNVGTALTASPLGGELVISASTTADNTYDIAITNEDGTDEPDWIKEKKEPSVKGFHKDEIVLYAEKNSTEVTRKAKVTISYGDGKSQEFTVTQRSAFMDFVYTEENPIEWEETFGLFSDSELKYPLTKKVNDKDTPITYKNVFRIELSDDFLKGTYKITNMFYAESYNDIGNQPVSNNGATYYADYEGTTLIVKKNSGGNSYHFANETIGLNYDSVEKKFTSIENAIETTSDELFIGEYTAIVKEAAESGDDGFSFLFGTYAEDCSYPTGETLVIEASDNSDYNVKMKFFYTENESVYSYDVAYGIISADHSTITVKISGGVSNFYGPVSDFTLSINGGVISGNYAGMVLYTATKQ